jgi:hypothetical protein
MAMLVIAGQTIPPAQGWKLRKELGEDSMRANAGSLSSDVRWEKRAWSGPTELLTAAEVTTLRANTALAAQVACSGNLLGATVTCEVSITDAGYVTVQTAGVAEVLRALALTLVEV